MDNKAYVSDEKGVYDVPVPSKKQPLANAPYAGMGKEDLLRFSQTPFWNTLRTVAVPGLGILDNALMLQQVCLIIFWLAWLGLLIAVIVLTVIFPRCRPPPKTDWWQKTSLYQVYIRSFADSNGDGIGDLKGVQYNLKHIKDLRAAGVVLSSVNPSLPNGDHGYDILNHTAIHPDFGNLTDFKELLKAAHDKELKVIIDFIPNHTGKDHPWFVASARNDPQYKHYYVWANCTSTRKPNNWLSVYGGSAWTWHAGRRACYLHQFANTQPELNLRSAAVREELQAVLRFWLDLGVDGFRVNSATFLFEDADMRSEPSSGACAVNATDYRCLSHIYTRAQSEVHDMIARWRTLLEEYSDETNKYRVLLTDARESIEKTMAYYEAFGRRGAHLPLNYRLQSVTSTCDSNCVYRLVDSWIYNMPKDSTPNWLTGDQDVPRSASRLEEQYQNALHLLQLTLPGPAITYYGEELGMLNGNQTTVIPPGNPARSQDPYRTLMQWNDTANGGFTNSTTPWQRVNGDYKTRNVKAFSASASRADNVLKKYRELTKLRADERSLQIGTLHWVVTNSAPLSYIREISGQKRLLIAINFDQKPTKKNLYDQHYMVPGEAEVVFTTHLKNNMTDSEMEKGKTRSLSNVKLGAGQGVIYSWDYSR